MNRSVIQTLSKGAFIAIIMMIMWACNNPQKESNTSKVPEKEIEAMQSENDLLAGFHDAICYSGFRKGQHPDRGEGAKNPTDEQVLEDLNIIANDMGISLIRVYDCGENSQTVLRIIREENMDIKVMLGIWLKAELSAHETCAWLTEPIPQEILDKNTIANKEELDRGIMLANEYKDIIVAVNVGNEALVEWNDHMVDVDTIIGYCNYVKSNIAQPVTVADNYDWWANHGAKLATHLDFISIHTYPIWEGRDIDEGLSYTIENVEKVRKAIPDAKIVISEAGWATTAVEFGERASEEKQKRYNTKLMNWATENNVTTFLFEAFDEPWKGETGNPDGAEKHWGIYFEDRTPKLYMRDR